MKLREVLEKNFNNKEQKAAEQIFKLITEENLSIAELRGAAWEAMLMILKMPVVEFQNKSD